MRLLGIAGLLAATITLSCTASRRPTPLAEPRATLVVVITVDQLRADYVTRYGQQFTGGLARVLRGGAWYVNGFQDHANTETAPGHATILSGRFPRNTGIVSNDRGVPDTATRLLGSAGPGASPHRFRGATLLDWVRAREPEARALSVSRKDRGAILPLGRAREAVYWYAPEGRFTTSTYYADTLPTWVQAFNARRIPESMAGRAWSLLLPESAYAEPDSQPIEAGGRGFLFPHTVSADTSRAARTLYNYPWMDEILLEFTLTGITALDLGRSASTDIVAISLSTTDAIGHRYGPDSREIHDQMLRLDRALGTFIDSLYRLRDSAGIVMALTADHGVAPFPELYAARSGRPAGHVDLRELVAATRQGLAAHGLGQEAFRLEGDALWVDRGAFTAAGVSADSVVTAFADAARNVPGVLRVDPVRALAHADMTSDALARRWYHAIPPDLPIELVVTLQPHFVWGHSSEAQHGGPHDYDTRVPIVFYGPAFLPGRHSEPALVVDIAPTLAAALGVVPEGPVDGRVLTSSMR